MKGSAARLAGAAALSLLFAPALAPAAAPAGRYTASGGVVKDNKTGLYWQQATVPMEYSFADAVTYCSGNAAALSGTGWRLPAIKELQSLVDDSVASPGPTIDASAFPAASARYFWSSTPDASSASSGAWYLFFEDGSSNVSDLPSFFYVRCVR